MWNSFSIRYIKENRTASLLLSGAVFLASMLLSLMTALAYNLWTDHVKQETAKGVTKVEPTALFVVYAVILVVMCAALIAMIHNAFAVSMQSRLHQLGILKSVGATPRQIRTFLLQEAMTLSLLPMVIGMVLGIGVCWIFVEQAIRLGQNLGLDIQYQVAFSYHPLAAVLSLAAAFFTVLISAWMPAKKVSRLTPLEAIFRGEEPLPDKMRSFRLADRLTGVCGVLARRSLHNRRKSMRAAGLLLSLSFLGFFLFLTVETISGLSTQETYYDKYHDSWDIMLSETGTASDTIENVSAAAPDTTENVSAGASDTTENVPAAAAREDSLIMQLRAIPGVRQCISYVMADTTVFLPAHLLSGELEQIGPKTLLPEAEKSSRQGQDGWLVPAHLFVLDDKSFDEYCAGEHISSESGAVAINLLWDERNSDYMHREYIPFVKEGGGELYMEPSSGEEADGGEQPGRASILSYDACATALPQIREELEQKALNIVMSESAYAASAGTFSGKNYNILLEESIRENEQKAEAVEESVSTLVPDEDYTLEGRIREETSDAAARKGLRIVMGVLAGLLACVGIAGVLSATLGQLYQRRKEFARYLSVGVSPGDMKKMLFLEGFFIIGRPLLLAVLLDIPAAALMLWMSPPTLEQYLAHLPLVPMLLFICFGAVIVLAAYAAAAKRITGGDMVEILRDETMM
ncbi:MAG TPA: ABC transporter permease [Candidatus Anaerobutyricum stercoripullorum]|uniref:ABC transporter permease n=1 Tax=Candidatus Anaerobutyricum stercoripullorum TaxID=2838456 RepID=A0A9D1X641_9FIRM|nr:ABC transporter permease [Candidatus Anaerobutyricum stercoripullorum]